ncbi:MAG TPA: hypothetical protein VID95_12310, partial [Candidatus Limnocylindrales bacterium]
MTQSAFPSETSTSGLWRAIVAWGVTTVAVGPDAGGDPPAGEEGLPLGLALGLRLALGLGATVGPGWPRSPVPKIVAPTSATATPTAIQPAGRARI